MRPGFDKATTVRVRPEVNQEIRSIAQREGNTESAVIRRALSVGLDVIRSQQPTGSPDSGRAA